MKNRYTNKRIEFHILQSFPVTCLNRDDVGAPKTAIIGGVTRARVSSQSWKRQVRLALRDLKVTDTARTLYVKDYLLARFLELAAELDCPEAAQNADDCAEFIVKKLDAKAALDKKTNKFENSALFFIANNERERLAQAFAKFNFSIAELEADLKEIKSKQASAKKESDKEQEEIYKQQAADLDKLVKVIPFLEEFNLNHDGLDIALFGRMVANAPSLHIEAAASFSHAISTHAVANEIEFFTAVDDDPNNLRDDAGSAHMGSLEFNSATYYRYISLDLGQLIQTLGDKFDLKTAITAFTQALFVAVPSARQTTQSGASPWEFARVLVREAQRLQVPFETPVKAARGEAGFLQPSIQQLKTYLDKKAKMSGSLFGQLGCYEWGENEDYSIDDLITDLHSHL